MTALLQLRTAPPRRRRRRIDPGTPVAYLAGIVVVGITVVPLLYVVIDGFRTTAQINQAPSGLPHPWVVRNYVGVLTSGEFWEYLGNSALIAVIATALSVGLGSMV